MPRIAKNAVRFPVDGQQWLATFQHEHNETGGIAVLLPGNTRISFVKHMTTCVLTNEEPSIEMAGASPCSMKDHYDWKRGIKRALQKALESGGHCRFAKDVRTREEVVWPLTPTYGKVLASFYKEMPIKDYPPHNQKLVLNRILEGDIISADKPEGDVPPENTKGLAYGGMD